RILMFCSLLLLLGAFTFAQPPGRYIVVFTPQVSDEVKAHAVAQAGGTVIKHLRLINGTAVILPTDAVIAALSRRGEVKRVDEDLVYHATGKPPPPAQVLPWGIGTVKAPSAWSISQGTAVKVAIMDTGIDLTHPDLQPNIKGGYNPIKPNKSANDDNGHGTHVAGSVAAVNNAIGVIGVAPQVNLYAVKVLNAAGKGFLSDIIEGLQWCIENKMQVVNMSFGSDYGNTSEYEAIYAAFTSGITLVAAAGNDGYANSVDYPAVYPEVIAVTAIDRSLKFASFSSYGPEVDITAPGVQIYSTYKGSKYATMSGTSMASPHVTGVVALRLAQNPNQSPAEIKLALQSTARDLGLPFGQQGAGLVDAEAVVNYPLFFLADIRLVY
ncbi:MAG: S8 family peptidase, partial [bacterium]|nr:S8 family peptidase [bacterium]